MDKSEAERMFQERQEDAVYQVVTDYNEVAPKAPCRGCKHDEYIKTNLRQCEIFSLVDGEFKCLKPQKILDGQLGCPWKTLE
ncbi:MAG: hypothetical protein ACOX69_09565 [Coriobacteriales bacterium]